MKQRLTPSFSGLQILLVSALVSAFVSAVGCSEQTATSVRMGTQKGKNMNQFKEPVKVPMKDGKARAYFASGCFWCVEAVYESVRGVEEAISGYSGGHTENPTYESSNTGKTGHAESVEVIYDPDVVDFAALVDVYFGSQNVTQVNGQGPDRGSQYRSILFYQDEFEKKIIEDKIAALNAELGGDKVAAEVLPFQKFWVAEDYHQNYERLHPNDGYVRGVSIPRLQKFQAKFPGLLKESSGDPE